MGHAERQKRNPGEVERQEEFWKDNGTTCQHYSQDEEADGWGISHDCGHVDRFYLGPRAHQVLTHSFQVVMP
jgi:hypothetical protein